LEIHLGDSRIFSVCCWEITDSFIFIEICSTSLLKHVINSLAALAIIIRSHRNTGIAEPHVLGSFFRAARSIGKTNPLIEVAKIIVFECNEA